LEGVLRESDCQDGEESSAALLHGDPPGDSAATGFGGGIIEK